MWETSYNALVWKKKKNYSTFPIATFPKKMIYGAPKVKVPKISFAFSSSAFQMKLRNSINNVSSSDVIRIYFIF